MSTLASPTHATVSSVPAAKARRRGDSRRLRRRVGGITLITAPLALLASEVTDRGTSNSAKLISDAAHHSGLIAVSNALLLLSSVLIIPAAFAVLHLARDRGRRFAEFGTAFAVLGALGHAVFVGFSTVVLSMPQGGHAQMVALLDRVNHSPAAAPIVVCIFAFAISMPLLGVGAWRAGLAPVMVPIALGLATLVEMAGVGSMAGGIIKEGLAVFALGWIGLRLLRLSDDAWSLPARG